MKFLIFFIVLLDKVVEYFVLVNKSFVIKCLFSYNCAATLWLGCFFKDDVQYHPIPNELNGLTKR